MESSEPLVLGDEPRSVPAVSSYTEVFVDETRLPQPVLFNGDTPRELLLDVVVTGLEVVVDPSNSDNEFARFDAQPNIGSLLIVAEEVFVRSTLHLPRTGVTVYARRLVFEDTGDETSRIDTSPLPFEAQTAAARTTLDGEAAGELNLYLAELVAPGDAKRFVLNGSDAQKPIAGAHGNPASYTAFPVVTSVKYEDQFKLLGIKGPGFKYERTFPASWGITHFTLKGTVREVAKVLGKNIYGPKIKMKSQSWGTTKSTPRNGADAKAGGPPGNGGDAGVLRSTLANVEKLAERRPGEGSSTPAYRGGQAQQPTSWQQLEAVFRCDIWSKDKYTITWDKPKKAERRSYGRDEHARIVKRGTTRDGRSYPAASGKPGVAAPFELVEGAPNFWVRPTTLHLLSRRARDLHLAGDIESARDLVAKALDLASDAVPFEGEEEDIELELDALVSMQQRLAYGLDYFGNPPGWVPMLSFEANYKAFQEEISSAVQLLYFAHRLEEFWSDQDERQRTVDWAVSRMDEEVAAARETYRTALQVLPVLEEELGKIEDDLTQFLARFEAREAQIIETYEHDQKRKELIRTILTGMRTACEGMIWAGGKKAGATAAVASGALVMVEDHALRPETLPPKTNATDVFHAILDAEEVEKARERLAALDPAYVEDHAAYVKELRAQSKVLSGATRDFVKESVNARLYEEEGGAEIQAYLEKDKKLQSLFDDVVGVITVRQVFTGKVTETLWAIEDSRQEMLESAVARDKLQGARAAEKIDLDTRRTVREMQARAKDRLLQYQYHLAKSYEYRMLEPCPIDFRRNELFDAISKLFGKKAAPSALRLPEGNQELADYLRQQSSLPPFGEDSRLVDYLALIYEEDLREIVRRTLDGLNERRPEPVVYDSTLVLTETELRRLNENGVVTIDLESRVVFPSDENARIVKVRVSEGKSAFSILGSSGTGNLDVTFEPQRRSTLTWNGNRYSFRYGTSAQASLVRWGFTWSPDRQEARTDPTTQVFSKVRHLTPSQNTRSLFAVLVDERFADRAGAPRVRFRPGARTNLVVRKEVHPDDGSFHVRLDSLTCELKIEKNKSF